MQKLQTAVDDYPNLSGDSSFRGLGLLNVVQSTLGALADNSPVVYTNGTDSGLALERGASHRGY